MDPIITNPNPLNPKMPEIEQSTVNYEEYIDKIINANAQANPPSPAATRIPRVLEKVKRSHYEKYYVPKAVSIGPYHFGKKELEPIEKLKPVFTNKLLAWVNEVENNEKHIKKPDQAYVPKETLKSLYNKLGEQQILQTLRSFYEKDSTAKFSDAEFTNMMLLDCCFILYYIGFYVGGHEDCGGLNKHQIVIVHQDLFLLENQIPYKVLMMVADLLGKDFQIIDLRECISIFLYTSSFVKHWWPKRNWLTSIISRIRYLLMWPLFKPGDHLLHVLHRSLTENAKVTPRSAFSFRKIINRLAITNKRMLNFRNVNELVDVGIQFKPSDSMSLSSVEFSKGWLRFSANVKLPRITLDNSTKHMLFNMMAYERCTNSDDAWVTSYVCLLDSLIDCPEDVKILRKAWVLESSLGSDEEVAKLFNEIGTDLVPNDRAYMETKSKIQEHYNSWRNTLFWQLKNEYFKSPWAIFVLLGALIALFLSAASTYYTRWSPKGECDDLCNFLKINHHL